MSYTAMTLLGLTGAFLMFIVLLQRGRGGGLAGAFGGMGGQSAFGTKAGDVFTRITVVVAVVWVVLAGLCILALRYESQSSFQGGSDVVSDEPELGADDGDQDQGEADIPGPAGIGEDPFLLPDDNDQPAGETPPETTDDDAALSNPGTPRDSPDDGANTPTEPDNDSPPGSNNE
ncbi:MAG: preprotein translocase subunit SecG [Planctomycetaceae bacterium]